MAWWHSTLCVLLLLGAAHPASVQQPRAPLPYAYRLHHTHPTTNNEYYGQYPGYRSTPGHDAHLGVGVTGDPHVPSVRQQQEITRLHSVYRAQQGPLTRAQPEDIDFQLYTRHNPTAADRLVVNDWPSISASHFNASLHTLVLVHGFNEDADLSPWIHICRDWFLRKEAMNVVVVQWKGLANLYNYYQSARNARYVGAQLGLLLLDMHNVRQLSSAKTYMIGFSLGAHVAGIAGQSFKGVSRITGLDPAGPAFEGDAIDERLDETDAQFVDIIHTNYGGLTKLHFGYEKPLGHVDFYVNGGDVQLGCPAITTEAIIKFLSNDLKNFHACSHDRAYVYFIENLYHAAPASGFYCETYQTFEKGECLETHMNNLGLSAKNEKPGSYYLDTQGSAHYLSRAVKVTATIGQQAQEETIKGGLDLIAYPLDTTFLERKFVRGAHTYSEGEKLVVVLSVPLTMPVSSVPLQLQFSRNLLHTSRNTRLNITQLQLADTTDSNAQPWYVCDLSLPSREWVTIIPTQDQC